MTYALARSALIRRFIGSARRASAARHHRCREGRPPELLPSFSGSSTIEGAAMPPRALFSCAPCATRARHFMTPYIGKSRQVSGVERHYFTTVKCLHYIFPGHHGREPDRGAACPAFNFDFYFYSISFHRGRLLMGPDYAIDEMHFALTGFS